LSCLEENVYKWMSPSNVAKKSNGWNFDFHLFGFKIKKIAENDLLFTLFWLPLVCLNFIWSPPSIYPSLLNLKVKQAACLFFDFGITCFSSLEMMHATSIRCVIWVFKVQSRPA
jgi:hypothetical protein